MTPERGPIALLIPAYRPQRVLVDVVREVASRNADALFTSILVVDDGSGSECEEVFASVARCQRVAILRRNTNGGKGAALKTGMAALLESIPDLLGVVTADADGQHLPADVMTIARTFAERPDALVLGGRVFGADVPLRSRLGNLITKRIVALTTGLRVADTQTGLRGWPRCCCERSLRMPADRYEFELMALLDAAAAGIPIVEVPIRTIYQPGNPTSHFRPLGDSARIYGALARHIGRRFFRRG